MIYETKLAAGDYAFTIANGEIKFGKIKTIIIHEYGIKYSLAVPLKKKGEELLSLFEHQLFIDKSELMASINQQLDNILQEYENRVNPCDNPTATTPTAAT